MRPNRILAAVAASIALMAAPALPSRSALRPRLILCRAQCGASIAHKERIHTTPAGSVQLLFLNKSTLSIAPNTNILIDEYVYDPNSGNGHMLANRTQGALRFVGGKLSHQGEAELATPAAAIGIRGGTVTVHHDKRGTRIINHFGTITIHNGAGSVHHQPPGIRGDHPRLEHAARRAGPRYGERDRSRLSSVDQQAWTKRWCRRTQDRHHQRLRHRRAEQNAGGVQGKGCPDTSWMRTDAGQSDAFQTILQSTQQATGRAGPGGRSRRTVR